MEKECSKTSKAKELTELLAQLAGQLAGRRLKVMEVCGTHTVTARSTGLHALLPANVKLISGPGCPVCVTPGGYIEQAVQLALEDNAHIMTYGDMIRVPGVTASLDEARRRGAKVSVVYSANDALCAGSKHSSDRIVFLGIGFETTAPATAFVLKTARQEGLHNFTVLSAHKRVIPAMEALLADAALAIDAFIAPGHVSVIIGTEAYKMVAEQYDRPCVVTGFDGEQMLMGLVRILSQLVAGRAAVENVYGPRVSDEGNREALELIDEVMRPASSCWRGLGNIEQSGLAIRSEFAQFDAQQEYNLPEPQDHDVPGCRCGDVLKGIIEPTECRLFARKCTPATPVGACMVSREGSCRASYSYRSK